VARAAGETLAAVGMAAALAEAIQQIRPAAQAPVVLCLAAIAVLVAVPADPAVAVKPVERVDP